MVAQRFTDDEVDLVFQALADATRRDIVSRVLVDGVSVSGLATGYAMSFAAVQKHVAVLERAHLVTKERRGREQIVTGNADTIARTTRLLADYEQLWRDRIDRIDDLLADGPAAEASVRRPRTTMREERS